MIGQIIRYFEYKKGEFFDRLQEKMAFLQPYRFFFHL